MTVKVDLFEVLGVDRHANKEELEAAYETALADRQRRRRSSADVRAAYAVLSDPSLRRAHELALLGREAGRRIGAAREAVEDRLPDVDWAEVRHESWQTALKATVLASGVTARMADATGSIARRVQLAAARRIERSAGVALVLGDDLADGFIGEEHEEVRTEGCGQFLDAS